MGRWPCLYFWLFAWSKTTTVSRLLIHCMSFLLSLSLVEITTYDISRHLWRTVRSHKRRSMACGRCEADDMHNSMDAAVICTPLLVSP